MFEAPAWSWAWPLALALMGAIVGSFVATIVIRWPQGRSAMRGRSACDACGRTLRAVDLVPIVSAIALRGRCRTCHAPIDRRHRGIEVAALVIGALAGFAVPSPVALAGAAFGWLLLTAAAIDAAELWLPDRLTLVIALAGGAAALLGVAPDWHDRAIGGAAGFASLWLVAAGYRWWRGHEGLGGGDPKLLGAIGVWLGWSLLPAVLVLAGMIGLGVALLLHWRGHHVTARTALPFGTFLAIAAYPAWLVMITHVP